MFLYVQSHLPFCITQVELTVIRVFCRSEQIVIDQVLLGLRLGLAIEGVTTLWLLVSRPDAVSLASQLSIETTS